MQKISQFINRLPRQGPSLSAPVAREQRAAAGMAYALRTSNQASGEGRS